MAHIKRSVLLWLLPLALIATFFISLLIGRYFVPPIDAFSILLSKILNTGIINNTYEIVIVQIRLPRIILALLVGASLAVAGTSYQSLFRNPIVDPSILGVSSGAAFGAALAIVFFPAYGIYIQILAFCFGFAAVLMTLAMSRIQGASSTIGLVLAGVAVTALFSALVSILKYISDPYGALASIVFWLMGGLWTATWGDVLTAVLVILPCLIIILLLRWRLNILSMGDKEAKALGVNVGLLKTIIIFLATLATAAAVSVSGIIGWVGLIIPNMMRSIFGSDNRILLPASCLMGAIFLIISDDIARTITSAEIPIGIITAIIGVPLFAYILRQGLKRGNME